MSAIDFLRHLAPRTEEQEEKLEFVQLTASNIIIIIERFTCAGFGSRRAIGMESRSPVHWNRVLAQDAK